MKTPDIDIIRQAIFGPKWRDNSVSAQLYYFELASDCPHGCAQREFAVYRQGDQVSTAVMTVLLFRASEGVLDGTLPIKAPEAEGCWHIDEEHGYATVLAKRSDECVDVFIRTLQAAKWLVVAKGGLGVIA